MSTIKEVLKDINVEPEVLEINLLHKNVNSFVSAFKKALSEKTKEGQVFLGGSYAKNTLVNKKVYDVDVFIRLPKNKLNTKYIGALVKHVANQFRYKISEVKGSRPYYRVKVNSRTVFEVVPALKISKPRDAENVIDLSFFHVSYVKNKINKNKRLAREIRLAKTFCASQGVYGAESYIRGFSGYALECLIIYYKTLENMLKKFAFTKEKIVIDPEKHYRNAADAIYNMNESKTQGPLVIVDPTWNERNVAAAVSYEAFARLQMAAKAFIKKPSKIFFKEADLDMDKFRNSAKVGEKYAKIIIETNKQDGDIAGTKLKKFSKYFILNLQKVCSVRRWHFEYSGRKQAIIHIIAKPKTEIIQTGPPTKMLKAAKAFKEEHKKIFEKSGKLYAKIPLSKDLDELLYEFIKREDRIAKQMSITEIGLKD